MSDAPSAVDARSRRGAIIRWAAGILVAVGLLGFVVLGANRPADPQLLPHSSRPQVQDFGEIAYRISGAGNERCALLAETAAQQGLGLMNRTDLGGYDGMLFKFASDTNSSFYMKDTPLPLSIAFFDASGQFVSTTDMAPCIHQASCPTYAAARNYRWALEIPQGALPRLAIGPGTRIVTGGPCT